MNDDTKQLLEIVARRFAKTAAGAFRSSIDALGKRTFRDSRVATSAFIVVAGMRLLIKLAKRKSEVAYSVVLKPGETVEVRHLAPNGSDAEPSTGDRAIRDRAIGDRAVGDGDSDDAASS